MSPGRRLFSRCLRVSSAKRLERWTYSSAPGAAAAVGARSSNSLGLGVLLELLARIDDAIDLSFLRDRLSVPDSTTSHGFSGR